MSGWRYAFSLSGDEVARAEPPGTSKLIDHGASMDAGHADRIILVPQPTTSGLDPLNLPRWRKLAIVATVCLYATATDFLSAAPAPALTLMAAAFEKNVSSVTQVIAINVLIVGAANLIWVPLANVYGRRIVLLVGTLLMTAGSIWCALATSYSSLLAARAIQALGQSPGFSLPAAIIGDIFFLHERGRAMTFYASFLAVGSSVAGIAGGYIGFRIGYQYIFWVSTAISGFLFLCCLLIVPETLFDRTARLDAERGERSWNDKDVVTHVEEVRIEAKQSYLRSLGIGGVKRGGLVRQFIAPWMTLALPGLWVVMLQIASLVAGVVSMSTAGPLFLAYPPYAWGENSGLFNVGGLIGTGVAFLVTYLIVDKLLKRQGKRASQGFVEAEARLPLTYLGLILAVTGLWTYGFSAAHSTRLAWVGVIVGYGMLAFGLTQVPAVAFAYLIEAYGPLSADCFTMLGLLRGAVSFAWTYFVQEWLDKSGSALPFGIFGMIVGVFTLLTIPLMIYGKRSRIATAKLVLSA